MNADRFTQYVEHLDARLRGLPEDVSAFCRSDPKGCLALVVRVLEERDAPELIEAVGDELLEQLLNENVAVVQDEVLRQLRTNRRFRQAFACGTYSSVDPAVIDEWVLALRDIGTTKVAERKSLRRGR